MTQEHPMEKLARAVLKHIMDSDNYKNLTKAMMMEVFLTGSITDGRIQQLAEEFLAFKTPEEENEIKDT